MKILSIVSDRHPALRKKSTEIKFPLEKHITDLAKKMREYLINSQDYSFLEKHPRVRTGVGLAAPQIGKNIRMFAVYFENNDEKFYDFVLINPRVTSRSATLSYLAAGEGCLSVDIDHPGFVVRNASITIEGYDVMTSQNVKLELGGYPSIVFQHEFDHLDGILFYDRIDKENPTKPIDGAIVIE